MQTIDSLLAIADAYKQAAGIDQDSTVSHRVFGDGKKLSALRDGADITVRRFNVALLWFQQHWPEGVSRPFEMAGMDGQCSDIAVKIEESPVKTPGEFPHA